MCMLNAVKLIMCQQQQQQQAERSQHVTASDCMLRLARLAWYSGMAMPDMPTCYS